MELRHIRYFIAVAREENVSRAAMKLHLSQPALSRQIQDLEEELGFALLERTAKSVHLTPAGKVFLGECEVVLQRVEQAVDAARAAAGDGGGELNVGYAPSPTVRLLPATLRRFQERCPGVRARLHDMTTGEMIAGIMDASLSIALSVRPTPAMLRGLRFEELVRDSICLAVSPRHPFARMQFVTLDRAVREPFVAYNAVEYPEYRPMLVKLFEKTGRQPKIVEELDSGTSMVAAIEAGQGVAMMPQSLGCIAGGRLSLVALDPPAPPVVIGALWRGTKLSGVALDFLECARSAGGGIAKL
jgi:DNA-binding transcriptional LysR family regulator